MTLKTSFKCIAQDIMYTPLELKEWRDLPTTHVFCFQHMIAHQQGMTYPTLIPSDK